MSLRDRLVKNFRVLACGLVTGVQLPTVIWACTFTHSPLPALWAAAVSAPYLLKLDKPWSDPAPRLLSYLALGWWASCLAFDVLLIPALIIVRAGAPSSWVWGLAAGLALAVGADAVVGEPRVRRRTVKIAGLAPALRGYRIGQLSDVHCGPHVPEARVARWVRRLNAQKLDLVTVTGDLITRGDSHVEPVARALGGLRARDGAFVSLGNHDYFTDGEQLVRSLEQQGLRVLRNEGVVVNRLDARLYVAGVDDTWTNRDDVDKALKGRPPGTPVVLLAHDPDLFPEAQKLQVDLMLSGHTHGGQLAIPGAPRLNLAHFMSGWTSGLYHVGCTWLYVSRGAGTTGPPVRFGAAPELTVLTLEAA